MKKIRRCKFISPTLRNKHRLRWAAFGERKLYIKHLPYVRISDEHEIIIHRWYSFVFPMTIMYIFISWIYRWKQWYCRSKRDQRSAFHTRGWQWSRLWTYSPNFWFFFLQKHNKNQLSIWEKAVFLMNMHVLSVNAPGRDSYSS